MTAILARSPLQSLPMASNRPTTRRRSVKTAFEDDEPPAPKRPKTDVNGASQRTTGAAKKATKTAYDENDDGFQFTRRTSRRITRVQPQPQPQPDPIPEEPPRPARKKKNSIVAPEPAQAAPQKRRRSARLSGDKHELGQVDGPPEAAKPAPKRTKKSTATEKEKDRQVTPGLEKKREDRGAFAVAQTPKQNGLHVSKKRDGATKIMLPFADTPVITRNKEMRKASKEGHRRSSTGLRGRRASSLIDSGMSNALPHSEVEVRDFYKYIEQSLPEPRRMKQLLTWCGSRALPEKPSGDVKNANAIMAARAIQQEMIDDFASKPELSDWFSREDVALPTVIKKPNPQNEKNKATLAELEEEVKRLEDEKAAWEALASSSTSMPPPVPPIIQPNDTSAPSLASIDTSLLDPAQAALLASLQNPVHPPPPPSDPTEPVPPPPSSSLSSAPAFTFTTPAALHSHLAALTASLEPHIDLFADGVHKIEQYRLAAERVADRVLGTAAKRLEERERSDREAVGSEGIGVGDVLRGLAGVLNE